MFKRVEKMWSHVKNTAPAAAGNTTKNEKRFETGVQQAALLAILENS